MSTPLKTEYAGPVLTERFRFDLARNGERVSQALAVALLRPVDPDRLLDDPGVLALNREDDYMPYWAYLWPGAYLLAEAVAQEPLPVGARLLEIGCGLGLSGLVSLGRGLRVTFSDYDEAPFPYIKQSAQASGFDLEKLETLRLDWREVPNAYRFPFLIGADVLYESKLVPLVANLIAKVLEPGGLAMIAGPYRLATEAFPEVAAQFGLHVESSPVQARASGLGEVRGMLHRVTHRA